MRGDRPSGKTGRRSGPTFTPHARGSTHPSAPHQVPWYVYPACAGIDRGLERRPCRTRCLPRMRGDRPNPALVNASRTTFTPHARGSTPAVILAIVGIKVYPACAGIDPGPYRVQECRRGLPRMRGDRPELGFDLVQDNLFTPHARGSTVERDLTQQLAHVYPACAGIDPRSPTTSYFSSCLPRMRGDRPTIRSIGFVVSEFTPHARGSTPTSCLIALNPNVYPACAGIDPKGYKYG